MSAMKSFAFIVLQQLLGDEIDRYLRGHSRPNERLCREDTKGEQGVSQVPNFTEATCYE